MPAALMISTEAAGVLVDEVKLAVFEDRDLHFGIT